MVREGNPDRVLWDVLLDKQGDTGDCWPIASLLILARKLSIFPPHVVYEM